MIYFGDEHCLLVPFTFCKVYFTLNLYINEHNESPMLTPIGDHILVQPLAKEEVTKSGIVLPDSAQQKPQEGTVLAVGSGKYIDGTLVSFKDVGVAVGQVVMFTKYGPTEVKVDGQDLYILDSGDILGVVEKQ